MLKIMKMYEMTLLGPHNLIIDSIFQFLVDLLEAIKEQNIASNFCKLATLWLPLQKRLPLLLGPWKIIENEIFEEPKLYI